MFYGHLKILPVFVVLIWPFLVQILKRMARGQELYPNILFFFQSLIHIANLIWLELERDPNILP